MASDHAVLTGDQQSEGNDSVPETNAADDGGEQHEDEDNMQVRSTPRTRQRANFPWSYTHDWTDGDPPRLRSRRQCVVCKKWFSASTNAQGWKAHLKTQHRVLSPAEAPPATLQLQQTIKRPLPSHVVRKFENAIVDYVIGCRSIQWLLKHHTD